MLTIVTNYAWFMDLGLGQATIKYVAEHAALAQWREVRQVFWTSAISYSALGGIAGLAMIVVAPLCVYRWFTVTPALQPDALLSFYYGSVALFLGMLNYAPTSLMRGLQRFDIVSKISMAVGLLQPTLTVALVRAGAGVPVVVLGNVAITTGALLVNSWAAYRLVPDIVAPVWHGATFRKIARFGSYLGASSLVVPLLLNLEKFLLASSWSMASVTYYMVPHGVAARLGIIPGSLSHALFPAFSGMQAQGELVRSGEVNMRVGRAVLLMMFPLTIVPAIFALPLLSLWLGADFAAHSSTAFQLLLIATLCNGLTWTPHFLLQALGYAHLTLRIFIVELLICAPVAVVAVQQWGVNGAALAWLFRAALDLVIVWIVAGRITGVPFAYKQIFDARVVRMAMGAALIWVGYSSWSGSGLVALGAMLLGVLLLAESSGGFVWELRRLVFARRVPASAN